MKTIHRTREELVEKPLWHHNRNLIQTASGYGKKLTTKYKTRYGNKLYRIYCCCFSNSGTLFIISKGQDIIVNVSY